MKFFDLFAGVGGFRIGFEREGYRCVGFCEIDRHARKLYKAYYETEKKGEFEWDDVNTLPLEEAKKCNSVVVHWSLSICYNYSRSPSCPPRSRDFAPPYAPVKGALLKNRFPIPNRRFSKVRSNYPFPRNSQDYLFYKFFCKGIKK